MKITVLGCGSSGGVPLIGGSWGNCNPENPRNRRTRVSLLIEHKATVILVDTSPDMRAQLLEFGLEKLDAVLYTHAHADHCHGIDELRSVNWLTQKPVDVYADPITLTDLAQRFSYIFNRGEAQGYGSPAVLAHEIHGPFSVKDLAVIPFYQNHGTVHSLGFRFGDFAYSTDAHILDDKAFEALKGVKTWIVDCVRMEPHPTHSHLEQTLEWIKKVGPEKSYLTHMNHTLDYDTLLTLLPPNVLPAHDGLVIEC